jgi:hypothetical protein
VAAFGAGSFLGGLIALYVRPRRPLVIATLGLTVLSLPLASLALTLPVQAIAFAGLVSAGGLMISNAVWETTLQRHVPTETLSRVSAYDWVGSFALRPIGLAVWGPVAATVGVSPALWLASVLQFVSVLALFAVPEVLRLPAFNDGSGEPRTPISQLQEDRARTSS